MGLQRYIVIFMAAVAFSGSRSEGTSSGNPAAYGGYNYGQQQQQGGWQGQVGNYQQPEVPSEKRLPPLPPGWSEHVDPASGQSYYYNSADGTTTWDRPMPTEPTREGEGRKEAEEAVPQTEEKMGEEGEVLPGDREEIRPITDEPTAVTEQTQQLEEVDVQVHDQSAGFVEQQKEEAKEEYQPERPVDTDALTGHMRSEERIRAEMAWRESQGWRSSGEEKPVQEMEQQPTQQQQQEQDWGARDDRISAPDRLKSPTGWGASGDGAARGDERIQPAAGQQPREQFREPQRTDSETAHEQKPPSQLELEHRLAQDKQQYQHRAEESRVWGTQQDPRRLSQESWQSQRPERATEDTKSVGMATQESQPPDKHIHAPADTSGTMAPPQPVARQTEPWRASANITQGQAPPQQQEYRPYQRYPQAQGPDQEKTQLLQRERPTGPQYGQRLPGQQPQEQEHATQQGLYGQQQPQQAQQHLYGRQQQPPPQRHPYGQYGQPQQPPPAQQGPYGQYGQYQPGAQYGSYGGPQGYGQRPGPGSHQLVPQESTNAVREALGSAWQGFLGFRNRTKEAVDNARSTVVSGAKEAGQSISTTSQGWWGQAKNTLGSVFETSGDQASQYSLSGRYGAPPAPVAGARPPPGYPQQQGYPPQQGHRPQQGYPPQQGYQPQQGYPPQQGYQSQQQQQPGHHAHQQQGRYPPGYGPPQPRTDPAYPHQQQQQGQRQGQQPPLQSQYPPNYDPNRYGQYPPQQPGFPGQQMPPSQQQRQQQQQQQQQQRQRQQEQEQQRVEGADERTKQADPWSHPGLGPDY